VGTAGLADFAGQMAVKGGEAAGLVDKETADNITRQNYEWYDPRSLFPLAGAGVRALAYGAGRGLNAINSDWGITDDDVKYATKAGINIFDDKSYDRAREARAKSSAALQKEITDARNQGADQRDAVVGTVPKARGQLVVPPPNEDGTPGGAPYFQTPRIAPRLRDATAEEAAELPIGNKTRQTLDFGKDIGSATFAYDPEREKRIKASMKLGLYDQGPRVLRAEPDGKGGFTPGKFAMNPTDPDRFNRGIQDYESVERGVQATRDLRAARLGISPEMLNAYDTGTPMRTLRAAETQRGVQAPGAQKGGVTKEDLAKLQQAFVAATKQGGKGKESGGKLPEMGEYFFDTLQRLTGSKERASQVMQHMLEAGYKPQDAAGLSQAVRRYGQMENFAEGGNPFDVALVSGEKPGMIFDGSLTTANRRSGVQKVWDEDDLEKNTYYELLRELGIE
jgi:hypothetical protein